MLGTTLGNYRIERELGRGGMGAVFVGTHTLLGRAAAIKVLLAKYSQDQDIVQRFFNEAREATAIEHPGIVEIYDYGKDANGCAFIVMELCQGESLGARIRRRHRFSIAAALTLTRQIAGTLAAATRPASSIAISSPTTCSWSPTPRLPAASASSCWISASRSSPLRPPGR